MIYNELNKIKDCKSVCLIAHIDPDCDALASLAVFSSFIKNYFGVKRADCFTEFLALPKKYGTLIKTSSLNPKVKQYDCAIMLDAPNSTRLGKYQPLFDSAKLKIVIDHHKTNNYSGDINIVEFVSSTCEILYKILTYFKYNLTNEDGQKLYAGIVTDTNNFSVKTVGENTFAIAGKLYKYIDVEQIASHYMSNSLKSLKIFAKCIENIEILSNQGVYFTHINKNYAKQHAIQTQDFEGVINKLAGIDDCKLICLVYPKNNAYYVSMRARNKGYDVAKIAKKYGGGGHVGASAFLSNLSLPEIKAVITEEFLKQIKNR